MATHWLEKRWPCTSQASSRARRGEWLGNLHGQGNPPPGPAPESQKERDTSYCHSLLEPSQTLGYFEHIQPLEMQESKSQGVISHGYSRQLDCPAFVMYSQTKRVAFMAYFLPLPFFFFKSIDNTNNKTTSWSTQWQAQHLTHMISFSPQNSPPRGCHYCPHWWWER